MYSNSNAFLGGNHQRQGGQQFGGGFNNMTPGQQQQQQQPGPFAPQPTGFAQQPLQQQYTGYPMQAQPTGMPQQPQALQQQYTGYVAPNQIQPGFQPGNAPPVPSIPSQFQQQFQQQQPQTLQSAQQGTLQPQNQQSSGQTQSPALMKPQPTGFTAMAASFQTGGGGATLPATRTGKVNRIPNVRLSFITASDQAKFETLFKSAIGDASTMSGDKARDLLLRSKLDGDSLSQIWSLSDTTRAGELYFPEFALAMYLCNLKLSGKTLPPSLPDNIKNEVSSIVDIIGFSVAEEAASTPAAASTTNAPDFLSANSSAPNQQPQQPQQASNAALLQSQMTGFPGQGAFGNQQQGVQAHQTGFPGLQNLQPTAYQGPRPPMPPMPTGYGQSMQSATPLNAQPTGIPGQWGLVNAPSSGLPNIDALQARMMPQQGREGGSFTTQGLQGNAVIPWAITKEEKTRYDSLFKAWDGFGKGYILGSQAIEIFGQSGLDKPDLERIWTLCDNGNKGRLDLDEFAVAMHLIYRKLNGYPIPNTLPSELVPPSTRNFNQSIGALKSMLHEESDIRKNSGAALLPQKTGVSYMKNRSFRGGAGTSGASRKDATVFRNDDESFGYRSSARRRVGNTSPRSASPSSVETNDDLSIEQLRKKIREKQVLLDAMDFQDEKNLEEDDILDRRDRRESEELYRRIRRIQDDIDAHPDAALASGDSDAEKRALRRQLQNLLDKVPELASQVRKTEKAIMDARLELFRLKDGKAHPSSTNSIVGTGPGGTVTESDRLKARAKAMMQQRTAALTGRKVDIPLDDDSGVKRLEQETITVKSDKESNERMVRDVEDSVRDFARGIEDSLKEGAKDQSSEHEKRRWEDGLGVEDEVRDFIFDLQRESRSNRLRTQDRRAPTTAKPAAEAPKRENTASPRLDSPASTSRTATPPATSGSYAAYKTPEERAAFIRQQAEQRMAERLAALGIKTPSKPGETPSQRSEREKAEKAEKLRQAEQEDARREAQRQTRLAEEQGVPPPVDTSAKNDSKKPPPPPSRHENRADTTAQEGVKKVEEEKLAREHEEQHKETQAMEETIKEEEDEFEKEQQAAGARLRALEEQVKQGKLKKEEEKRKKKLAMADAKERENKLAARRAEIEAAKQRELELQRQLEAMNDDTSSEDDEPPQQIVRRQEPETMVSADQPNLKAGNDASSQATNPVTSPTVVAPVPLESESRNPYKKLMSTPASNEATKAAPTVPSATQLPQIEVSTNPFHQMTQAMPQPVSRRRAGSEDWGSDKDEDDEQSDDERPGGGNAAQLASILFGTMAPPRPLSAAGKESAPASPAPAADTGPTSPPPPPPPMPGSTASEVEVSSNALPQIDTTPSPIPVLPVPSSPVTEGEAPTAPPPPPPPPPMPSTGAPPPPPPPMPSTGAPPPPPPPPAPAASNGPAPIAGGAGRPSGFLNEIQLGKSLKKTTTKDKSTASVAGRVLE